MSAPVTKDIAARKYELWSRFQLDLEKVDQIRPEGIQVMHEMVQRMVKKGHDYSGADNDTLHNLKASEDLGIPAWKGVCVRINDKWRRCVNFCRQSVLLVEDESFTDTLIDMAVYCVWCVVLWRERDKGKE